VQSSRLYSLPLAAQVCQLTATTLPPHLNSPTLPLLQQVPLGVSLGSMMLCAALNWTILRFSKQPAVLGFTAPATHPAMYPATEPSGECPCPCPSSSYQAHCHLCCAVRWHLAACSL
jgi:hypothetical protein